MQTNPPNKASSRLGVRAALFGHFSGLEVFSVSAVSPGSHPKRLTRAVRHLYWNWSFLLYNLVMTKGVSDVHAELGPASYIV